MGSVSLLRLQASAGNAAVARLLNPVQRKGDAGSCPPPPPTPAPVDPHADPKFAKIEKDVKGKAKDLKKHPPAAEEAKKAQDAAQPPGDDRASQAKAAQADTMASAKPKGFDKAAFVAAVKQAIAAAAPKNLDEADKFANSSKPGEIKAAVASKVTKGKDDSGKEVAEKTKQAPDPSVAKVKPVVPLKEEPPPPPAAVDGAKAMPDKAPKEQTDLRAGPCEVDAKMKDAEVTEEHLAKSNEAPMQEAAKAKKEAEVHAAEAPADIRQKEAAAQQTAQAGAGAGAKKALSAMVGSKGKLGGNVAAKKAAAKAQEEADRARISREINAIFDRTKTETEAKLTGLDAKVASEFDAGEAKAKAAFTAKHKADMEKYKDERYSGPTGWAQWTADLFTGLPPEANQIFDRAKVQYESEMTGVISRIADMIGKELEDAKARIEKGRQEIKAYVDSQPKELQKLAGETAKGVGDQFNQLESDVDAKQESLVDDLAQKYVEARGKVDEEIKAEQDKNKGLVDKAKEAVGGAIDAILKLKDLFMGLLAKAASAFTKILDDPLGFIGNFMNAIKTGFMNFANNILDHLKKGLMGWLLGALANAGIEIPDSFDLKGILKLVASILGLTWTNIKSRIVKIAPWIGKAIDVIESKVEVFVVLATKGVAGVWEWIKDKVGDLKEMVLGPIKDFVVEKIVKAGISWVLGMLNPAGALIKIVQALIGVVQWIMERGAALGEFISTVIDAVSSIAHGGAGGVPAKIEGALAKAVPLVISFLANLLGLGGISEKIKSVLETVQKPVGKAIDGLIKGALKAAKGLVKGLFGKRKDGQKLPPAEVKAGVARDLRSRITNGVPLAQVRPTARAIFNQWRDKGLHGLDIVSQGPTSKKFDIVVSASAGTKEHEYELSDDQFKQPAPFEGRHIPAQETRAAGSLVIPADAGTERSESAGFRSSDYFFRGEGEKKERKVRRTLRKELGDAEYKKFTKANTALHAEPVVLHELLSRLPKREGEPRPVGRLQLDVTRSPCPDCAQVILQTRADAEARGWRLAIRVAAIRLWEMRGDPAPGRQAVLTLMSAGVPVSVREITQKQAEEMGSKGKNVAGGAVALDNAIRAAKEAIELRAKAP